ncbi:hypothetical protein QF030_006443 [Streptomyces rishiriensis]|uniref:Uncharacterized protein n=1 Tax=Streptomyces rishiriensis TaxID=68264 RepID=A0ABU0NYP4_STRRH|nr:hypothetical protein [Streptomyces rishiriensis]
MTPDHKFGSTTITSEPVRIVTVGLTGQDAVLAPGKVPVGTTEWLGGYKGAAGPWAEDELGGAAAPTVLTGTGLPYLSLTLASPPRPHPIRGLGSGR